MKIEVLNIQHMTAPLELKISHLEESVCFNVAYYGRNVFNKDYDLFEQLNSYWSGLSEELQLSIYNCYRSIKATFESFGSREAMMSDLNKWSVQLLNYHDFTHLRNWIFFRSNIAVPSRFEETFVYDVDRQNTPDQTYLKGDYIDLVTMTLVFRTMMPVWGEYISMMRQEHGTRFKEYEAFNLIYGAEICRSHAHEKLMIYIDRTIAADRYNQTVIIDGISSEDFPTWVLARTIVRRLLISDIRGLDPKANIVTFTHKYVSEAARPDDSSGEQKVKNKTTDDSGMDQENKLSSFERYRVRHSIAIGELVEIEHSLSDLRSIAYRLSSNMNDALFYRSMETCEHLTKHRISEPQITLLRWVFKPVVSPRGLMYIDNHRIIKCLGVLQAVLWARGHKYLSLLSTAYANISDNSMLVSGSDSKARIPKELMEELDQTYPYQRMFGGKKTGYKSQNLAIEAVDKIVTDLSANTWTATADDGLISEVLNTTARKLPIPYEIKVTLAQFVLEIGRRTWI